MVLKHNSSETAQRKYVKLSSYEEHDVQMRIFAGNSDSFFRGSYAPFILKKNQKGNILVKQFVRATSLKSLNRIS